MVCRHSRRRLTNTLILQLFLQSRLHAAFRNFNDRFNNLVHKYGLPLNQMLSDVFHINYFMYIDSRLLR
jgi:hypothetical protein